LALDSAIGATVRRSNASARLLAVPLLLTLGFAPSSTESAVANGDTRTINLTNFHTNESGAFTYMVNGVYDSAVLEKLNWFLRDWRLNETTKMDPKLFDIVWEVYRESGSSQPIDVLSGYRSPHTNAILRRRSRQVARYSQHMEGKAIDAHFVDVGVSTIRDVAMRMQAGGVGFYPSGMTPWVHIDSGSVRYWPRMSRDALARLFPDGKTVFIPADGQPMPGYEQARAEIEARGGEVLTARADGPNFGVLAWLFGARGGGADDAEENGGGFVSSSRGGRAGGARVQVAAEEPLAAAKRDLPQGATFMRPAGPPTPAPQVASLDANARTDASPVGLHGPIAAQFIAPLPPHKPADVAAAQLAPADAPAPPQRPAELAFAPLAAEATGEEGAANRDLIAALLERGGAPRVITRGVGLAPSNALALAETTPAPDLPERSALLARAAALAAPIPPIAPTRAPAHGAAKSAPAEGLSIQPRDASTAPAKTAAAAGPPAAATRALATLFAGDSLGKPANPYGELSSSDSRPKPANPYGDLVYDAFRPAPAPRPAMEFADLRSSLQ
jgi:uncharacterized protein YcbK (DUF882 family)